VPGVGSQSRNDLELEFSLGRFAALRNAYDSYGSLVYTLCLQFLGEDPAASVTRDVFVRAWQDRARFDPSTASLGGWLMALARSRVLATLGHQPGDHGTAGNTADESEVKQVADRMLLFDALNDITGSSRMVVELALVDGLTRAEICERTTLPLSVVDSEISEGALGLRRALMAGGD
jgi:RNA polymerase sigma factor (sigma-70 family)